MFPANQGRPDRGTSGVGRVIQPDKATRVANRRVGHAHLLNCRMALAHIVPRPRCRWWARPTLRLVRWMVVVASVGIGLGSGTGRAAGPPDKAPPEGAIGARFLQTTRTIEPINLEPQRFFSSQVKIVPQQTTTASASDGTCNIEDPECFENGNCFCNVNENELLEFSLTFVWGDSFPPDLPMCIWISSFELPSGVSCPTGQGIGGATINCSWTSTYCQAGDYIFDLLIGTNCNEHITGFLLDVSAQNVNRLPTIVANPSGPIILNLKDSVHIDVSATDLDALECTDEFNKDVLTLTQTSGPGSFVDNGDGDGDFDWTADTPGDITVAFLVDDGKEGTDEVSIDIHVTVVPPDPPLAASGPTKNRAISFGPVDFEQETALRVRLTRLYIDWFEDWVNGCPAAEPTVGIPEPDFRWLGPPEEYSEDTVPPMPNFVAAPLTCCPHFRDWTEQGLAGDFPGADVSVIHVYGDGVMPCSVYDVQAIGIGCAALHEACFSDALEVTTALWGDVWEPFGLVSFTDIGKVVDKFKGIPYDSGPPESGAPPKVRAMLRENIPPLDEKVNFTDIGKVVDAFKSIPYDEPGPSPCTDPCP